MASYKWKSIAEKLPAMNTTATVLPSNAHTWLSTNMEMKSAWTWHPVSHIFHRSYDIFRWYNFFLFSVFFPLYGAVAGPGKKGKSDTDSMIKLKNAFSEALTGQPGVFKQNDEARQTKLDAVKGLEKADESAEGLTQQDLNYVLQTKKRSQSITLARRLYKTFFSTLGRQSPQDFKIEKDQLKQSRRDRKRKIIERRVLKLAQWKKPHPQVPPGSLDGFLQSYSGSAESSPNHAER